MARLWHRAALGTQCAQVFERVVRQKRKNQKNQGLLQKVSFLLHCKLAIAPYEAHSQCKRESPVCRSTLIDNFVGKTS